MDKIELVATNQDEAKEKAAVQLGVPADQVEIEVLEETKGLFGKPGKVTVSAWAKEAKEEKPKKTAKKKAEPKEEPAAEEAPGEEAAEEKPKAKPASKSKAPKSPKSPDAKETVPEEERKEVIATDEDATYLVDALNHLLETSGLEAKAELSELTGRYVNMQISGTDVGFLVGRRGEVLNAVQYLMNVVAARQLTNGVRVTLEGDNYREKRTKILYKMAEEIATQVKERGEEAVLDALPAFERRIIHQALVDFEGVNTYSEGEEPKRCVVIAPKE